MSDEDSRESATPSPTFCEGIERQDRVHRPNVDYGGDTEFSCCSIQSDALFSFDTYKWEDDDSALRSAAIQSRLPYDKMTDHELKFFPEFANQGSSLQFYLFVRNKILTLWHLDPLLELTFEAVLKEIPPPFNSDKKTLAGIHSYLQRYGLINYGVFMDLSKMKLSTPKRVIVIGAGIAGLAAARQLKFFGFEVTVLEGRRRIGGRIMTLRKEKNIDVDLGANIIQGIVGNPIVTLLQQMPLNISKFETQCPLFDNNGKPLDPRRTEMLRKSLYIYILKRGR